MLITRLIITQIMLMINGYCLMISMRKIGHGCNPIKVIIYYYILPLVVEFIIIMMVFLYNKTTKF